MNFYNYYLKNLFVVLFLNWLDFFFFSYVAYGVLFYQYEFLYFSFYLPFSHFKYFSIFIFLVKQYHWDSFYVYIFEVLINPFFTRLFDLILCILYAPLSLAINSSWGGGNSFLLWNIFSIHKFNLLVYLFSFLLGMNNYLIRVGNFIIVS